MHSAATARASRSEYALCRCPPSGLVGLRGEVGLPPPSVEPLGVSMEALGSQLYGSLLGVRGVVLPGDKALVVSLLAIDILPLDASTDTATSDFKTTTVLSFFCCFVTLVLPQDQDLDACLDPYLLRFGSTNASTFSPVFPTDRPSLLSLRGDPSGDSSLCQHQESVSLQFFSTSLSVPVEFVSVSQCFSTASSRLSRPDVLGARDTSLTPRHTCCSPVLSANQKPSCFSLRLCNTFFEPGFQYLENFCVSDFSSPPSVFLHRHPVAAAMVIPASRGWPAKHQRLDLLCRDEVGAQTAH